MQMHTDFRVPTFEELKRHRERAEALGATLLYDRSGDEGEPLYVLADPAGHPSACWLPPSSRSDVLRSTRHVFRVGTLGVSANRGAGNVSDRADQRIPGQGSESNTADQRSFSA
jgi:Glyoxalase-like domain